jgi:FecR protein
MPGPPGQAGPPPNGEGQMGQGQTRQMQGENEHGVGRISMTHGDVSTQRGDSGTWSAAVLNQPVVKGDKVSTSPGARAEVQLDFANILRLGSNSQAVIADFTRKFIQIQLGQGLATYTVFKEGDAEPEIDTPNVAVHPAHEDGSFRIEVRPDGDTVIIVRKGEAEISTPKGITNIKQGDMATVRGTAENAQYKIDPAPERDDWDRWNSDRDRMIRSANSWNHTNRYYVGSEDLDNNGRWENAPDYGQVWVPNEPDDWAPYRDGNWVWEPYYGWTWVGYEPWGWAPYHYGRWFWYGGAWAWWPGPVFGWYRPFWAPAYVSFFGWGAGWGFGFGFGGWGGFGWLPIGPGDWFHPWWGGWGGRFGVVGFDRFGGRFGGFAPLRAGVGFSNIAHFNDPHISRGLSTMSAGRFGTAGARAVAATHEQLRGARMMTGNMPVVPTRASLSASGRAAAPSTIRNGGPQHFFGTQSTARPASFAQETSHLQQSLQQNHFSPIGAGGRALAGSTEARGAVSTGAGKPSAGAPGSGRETSDLANRNAGSESGQGDRSVGSTNSTNHSEASAAGRGEPNRSEWKTFTPPSHSSGVAGGTAGYSARGESGSYWSRTAPSSGYSRASGAGGYSRPQLDMRQPIVQPRSSGGYGGYRGAPSYSGGSHSAPSSGGGHASGGGGGHASGGGHR